MPLVVNQIIGCLKVNRKTINIPFPIRAIIRNKQQDVLVKSEKLEQKPEKEADE